MDRVPQLDPETGRKVLRLFLELACQAQNALNIRIGRWGLAAMPRGWVLAKIGAEAEPNLSEGDSWEWTRLMEVCSYLDEGLMRTLAERAVRSKDPEIRECGEWFLEEQLGADGGGA